MGASLPSSFHARYHFRHINTMIPWDHDTRIKRECFLCLLHGHYLNDKMSKITGNSIFVKQLIHINTKEFSYNLQYCYESTSDNMPIMRKRFHAMASSWLRSVRGKHGLVMQNSYAPKQLSKSRYECACGISFAWLCNAPLTNTDYLRLGRGQIFTPITFFCVMHLLNHA